MTKYINRVGILLMVALTTLFAACSSDDNTPADPTLEPLDNQFRAQGKTVSIQSVVRFDTDGMVGLYLSPTAGLADVDAMEQANDYLKISLPAARLGLDIDLSQTGMNLSYGELTLTSGNNLAGSLKVTLVDSKIQVVLDAAKNAQELAQKNYQLECEYDGAFVYQKSRNQYVITTLSGEASMVKMLAAFRAPDTANKATTFVWSSVAGTLGQVSEGNYTLQLSVPDIHLDGKPHDFKVGDGGYQAYLINHATNKAVSLGEGSNQVTIKVDEQDAGSYYAKFRITLSDGSIAEGDYYGKVTEEETIDILPATNSFKLEGTYSDTEKNIESVDMQVSGTQTKFGFRIDTYNSDFDFQSMPVLTINTDLIGKQNIDLRTTKGWQMYYISYQAHDEKDPQWAPANTDGTLTVEKKANGNYRIMYKGVTDPLYSTGSKSTFTLSYEGPVEEK